MIVCAHTAKAKQAKKTDGKMLRRFMSASYGSSGFFLSRFGLATEVAEACLTGAAPKTAQPMTKLLVPWLRTVSPGSAHTTKSWVVDGSR